MNADEIVMVLRTYSQSLVGYKLGCEFADAVEKAASLIEGLQAQLDERDKEIERLRREVTNLAKESFERVRELAKLEAEVMQLREAQRCDGCLHQGCYENEVEYGCPSPCTNCKRRVFDNFKPLPDAPEGGAEK